MITCLFLLLACGLVVLLINWYFDFKVPQPITWTVNIISVLVIFLTLYKLLEVV